MKKSERNKIDIGKKVVVINYKFIFILSFVILSVFFASTSSAITCTQAGNSISEIFKSFTTGESVSNISIICSNPLNNTVTVNRLGNYVEISSSDGLTPFTIPGNQSRGITVSFVSSAPVGNYSAFISFSDSTSIPISINVNQIPSLTGCQLNPSLVWNVPQTVQLGTKFDTALIVFDLVDCPSSLSLSYSNVHISGGITTMSGQKPIAIKSVNSQGVVLSIDTEGLSTQTYSSSLDINVFGKMYQYPFNVLVTSGTSQSGNFTIDKLPTCSLTSNIVNLNSTYSLVCTNILSDVTIVPDIDENYIIGIGKSQTISQLIYNFKPVKFGNTIFKARFYYQDAPVGQPFSQELKIQSSGSNTPGTNLKFLFTPTLQNAQSKQEVLIQLIDNKTGSLVPSPEIYIDAIQLNSSSSTFRYSFESDKNYSIRGRAYGYDDIVEVISLSSKPITISISPEKGDSSINFNITTSVNASLFINGNKVDNPYYNTLNSGLNEIRAIKEGYTESYINISIDQAITASLLTEFKKGVTQTITLTKEVNWTIFYSKDANSESKVLLTGISKQIEFKPSNAGIYKLVSEDRNLGLYTISAWDDKFFGIHWGWIVGIVLVIGGIILYNKNSSGDSSIFGGEVKIG